MQAQIKDNASLLMQGLALLSTLSNEGFAALSPLGASVGGHFRHVLDFYSCFLRGLPLGSIDYDLRDRDSDVESNRDSCKAAVEEVLRELKGISIEADSVVRVKAEASVPALFANSTVAREMQFLSAHTIHHFALISYVLTERGFSVPPGFGVAPSTLAHMRTESLAG